MLRTKVKLGLHTIEVEAPTIKKLIEEMSRIQDLDKTRNGEDAVLFHRDTGEYKFYGFRRQDGAELTFGQKKGPDTENNLFGYHPKNENWKGFKKYEPNGNGGGQRQPAGGGQRDEWAGEDDGPGWE